MRVQLDGGYIETTGEYRTQSGVANSWRAVSTWTGETIECLTRGLAEFHVWIINERCQSEVMRGVRSA